MKDYILAAYISALVSVFIWFIIPWRFLASNGRLFYCHVVVTVILMIALASYRYTHPLS